MVEPEVLGMTLVLAGLGVFTYLMYTFIGVVVRPYYYRELMNAASELAVPNHLHHCSWHRSCYYRDRPHSPITNCQVCFFSEGIVVRDIYPHPPFLLVGRSGTVFVPWSMLGKKKPAILGWYLELWRGKEWVELHVARHSFSIIVPSNRVPSE